LLPANASCFLKRKRVVADMASTKHIDTWGALGLVENCFRACRR